MKYLYYLVLIVLTSCVTPESIIYNNDTFKRIETLNLKLDLQGYSDQRTGYQPDFLFTTSFLHSRQTKSDSFTTINLSVKTGISQKKLSPELYIITDNDTVKITSKDYFIATSATKDNTTNNETITSSPIQLMECTFQLDEFSSKKIANSEIIFFRAYIGDIGIVIKPDFIRRKKIANFFKRTLVSSGNLKTFKESY